MRIRIPKRYLFYILAFSSAILTAIGSGIDAIAQQIITDPWALGISCFILGIIVSGSFAILLSIPIKGKSIGAHTIDPTFQRIRLIKKEEIKYQLIAGLGNAMLTIGYFILLSIMMGDVSVVLPFTQITILFLVIIESLSDKDTPTLIEVQSAIIVTFGAMLGSISISGNINFTALAIVFFIINPGWVLLSLFQRKLKLLKINDKPNDAINIRVWNVIFACLTSLIIVFFYDTIRGTTHLQQSLYDVMNNGSIVILIASATFFSFIFYIRALGIGKASVTQAVKASVIVFTIPISIILGIYGIIPPFTTDPVMIIIKTMGIILMLLGILSYALTLMKAYIFINMKTGYDINETMKRLWEIKGVNRVTVLAGKYDFILKIRTRTLVKGYERILRKIEMIPGIEKFTYQSVLKEWEDV
jgi:DNA-binding Lrp family transcriptional regulator